MLGKFPQLPHSTGPTPREATMYVQPDSATHHAIETAKHLW